MKSSDKLKALIYDPEENICLGWGEADTQMIKEVLEELMILEKENKDLKEILLIGRL